MFALWGSGPRPETRPETRRGQAPLASGSPLGLRKPELEFYCVLPYALPKFPTLSPGEPKRLQKSTGGHRAGSEAISFEFLHV